MKKKDFKKFDKSYIDVCERIKKQKDCDAQACSHCPFRASNTDIACGGIQNTIKLAKEYIELFKEEAMENYFYVNGNKIPMSQETADSISKANEMEKYCDFKGFKNNNYPLIAIRNDLEYEGRALFLDETYNWEIKIDSNDIQCLTAIKK